MRLRHTDAPSCPNCDDKLRGAHPAMAAWFRQLKRRYVNVHVDWAYRNPAEQEACFKQGRTKLLYPHSKHNAMQDNKPCSLALDIFQIDEDGVGRFSRPFYEKVAKESWANNDPIIWGGDWNGNGIQDKNDWDGPHFELAGGEA